MASKLRMDLRTTGARNRRRAWCVLICERERDALIVAIASLSSAAPTDSQTESRGCCLIAAMLLAFGAVVGVGVDVRLAQV